MCYHMDARVIPQARQYYFYSRGIMGVIIHGHVINIDNDNSTVPRTSVLNPYINYIIKGDKECHIII